MKILGLGHYSRTGKDTLANYLTNLAPENKRVKKVSLAWKLKEICHDLYGHYGLQPPAFYDTKIGAAVRDVPLPVLDKTPVEIWVEFGTTVGRAVYDRTWIDQILMKDHGDTDLLIVPDVRFPNEAAAFREHGAYVVKCVRDGVGPKDTVADQALVGYDGFDYICGPNLAALERQAGVLGAWAFENKPFPVQGAFEKKQLLAMEGTLDAVSD